MLGIVHCHAKRALRFIGRFGTEMAVGDSNGRHRDNGQIAVTIIT